MYNDKDINHSNGVLGINNTLNTMKPKKSGKNRTTENEVMAEEGEYQELIDAFKTKYKGSFYKDIMFMDRKEFYEWYVDAGYFTSLA